jgi:hypothetical protein
MPHITRQRRRTEKEAINLLDKDGCLTPGRRKNAIQRIRHAKQPKAEVRRILWQFRQDTIRGLVSNDNELDLSDVQEVRVRLIQRDHGIWPPHTDYLQRMELMIIRGTLTPEAFKRMAATVLDRKLFPQPLSAKLRRANSVSIKLFPL